MKKSLLALAVVAVAASANAATVYDKDGTSLGINGRIQSVFYSGNHTGKNAGNNDSQLLNTARFGLQGKTQITDWVAGLGYAQWDMDNKGTGSGTTAREQYVGADFGEFGVLTAGKFRDASYYAENVTDHYEDAAGAVQGNFNGARRAGQIMYTYDNYGFHGQLGIQTAQDKAPVFDSDKGKVFGFKNKFNVDSGYSASLGYKTGDVVFGPLDFRVGYSYLKGQKGGDARIADSDADNRSYTFNNFKHVAAGISWGNLNSGLYLAALYDYGKIKGLSESTDDFEDFDDNYFKVKGFELSGGYAFDNGVSFLIGYESAKYTLDTPVLEGDFKVKRIPVFVNYKLNPNFNIWTEAGFNAGSDHPGKGVAKKIDKTIFSIGARYTF